ncbi:MAG TPA: glycosyltransferase [Deltaproteobacteria bacterium]|nr:glycosyltransferase [Deltaproteobacteria bacterium]
MEAGLDRMEIILSVVVPAYNEAVSLPPFVKALCSVLSEMACPYEIIVVDDGSTDETWNVLRQVSQSGPSSQLRGLRFTRNFGKEAAIVAGLQASQGRAAIVMDIDFQHPPAIIPQLVAKWRAGAKVVEAVKEQRQDEYLLRRWAARLYYFFLNRFAHLDLKKSSDFKLLDREVIDLYLALPERRRFFRGLIHWLGLPYAEVNFVPKERLPHTGSSRWSFGRLTLFAWRGITSFTSLPLQLVTILGVVTFLGAIVLGGQTLYLKWQGEAVEGFTTVILLQLLLGSIFMFSLGLIGEYLASIYHEIKHRPLYVVAQTFPEKASINHCTNQSTTSECDPSSHSHKKN